MGGLIHATVGSLGARAGGGGSGLGWRCRRRPACGRTWRECLVGRGRVDETLGVQCREDELYVRGQEARWAAPGEASSPSVKHLTGTNAPVVTDF